MLAIVKMIEIINFIVLKTCYLSTDFVYVESVVLHHKIVYRAL
jgi:hypothetical protein